jgi:hypothetical protein
VSAEPHLPYAPLEEYLLARHKPLNENNDDVLGVRRIAAILGVGTTTVSRWRRDGTVPIYAADKAAVTLGEHASTVWGEDWWAA